MPSTLLFEIVALIVSLAVALISLVLYLNEYRRSRKEKMSSPFENIEPMQEKSLNVLHRAMETAQSIIGNAELEGIKVSATEKMALQKVEENLEKELSLQMNKAYSEYIKFLEDLKEQNNEIQSANQASIKQRVDLIFDKFEQNLGTFLTSTEQKSVQSIELELRSARQLIETYKTQQIAIIDENIISILERTLTLVLAKKIPLKEQVDLIYDALNQAKVEKFVV